jgi:hypothetical protein
MMLAAKFSKVLGQTTGQISFIHEFPNAAAFMTLGGLASEVIARNRGKNHPVVPLCSLSDDVSAWVGYRERWQQIGTERSYTFVEGGFTIHVGRPGEISKPQIMRSEWVGRRSSSFGDHVGHPHWQLDVLETARTSIPDVPVRFDDVPSPAPVLEFGAELEAEVSDDLLRGLTIERMHLASAAPWWRQPTAPIANTPADVAELDRWILGCISYVRQEIKRCEIIRFSS